MDGFTETGGGRNAAAEPGEMSVAEARGLLGGGTRAVFLLRHAERAHIDNEDPTFGADLPLTGEGERTAEALGRMLAGVPGPVRFAASPLARTIRTAGLVARGMGLDGAPVALDSAVGNDSAFVSDITEMWRQFRDGRFFEKMRRWFDDGRLPGFNELGPACDAYEDHAVALLGDAATGVFATHDVFIAAFLHGRGVKTDFREENWPRFLDSAAIFLMPDGTRRYALVRAGLSRHCRGVAPDGTLGA